MSAPRVAMRKIKERLRLKLECGLSLYRWFVGLTIDDQVWDHSAYSFNRDRLFDETIAQRFVEHTVLLAQLNDLVSDDHFSVDDTLFEAWPSHKSFRPKDGSDDSHGGDFRGKKSGNDTHASTTDPDARLVRKGTGKEAKLSYQASTLMENRNGLLVAVDVRHATGTSERDAALAMLDERRIGDGATLGADKRYDTREFVQALKDRGIKTHIARNQSGRRSAVDGRTARGKGYAISQQVRKRIDQGFGWAKTIGGLRKLRNVGLRNVTEMVTWTFAACNLIRMGGIGDWWVPAPT